MATWLDYLQHYGPGEHSVAGNLVVLPDLESPQLCNRRDILVYLPPSYAAGGDRRYPVLYMHDGQNLFDKATAGFGEWRADETMEALAAEGLEAIIVGIPCMPHPGRANEYLPKYDAKHKFGGQADQYLDFLVDTVKPLIDADFRTLCDQRHTGIAGSSFGGLITLYALVRHPSLFGFAGIFSPAFWPANDAIYPVVEKAALGDCRIYMDQGTLEGAWDRWDKWTLRLLSRRVLQSSRRMERMLRQKGFGPDRLVYMEEKGGKHHEEAWARRLPGALRFLLKGGPGNG